MAPIPPELALADDELDELLTTSGEKVRNEASARGRSWRWVVVQPERTASWDNTKIKPR